MLNPIPKATWTVLNYDNVIHNTNGDWSDNKYTPKVEGYYNFNYSFAIATGGAGYTDSRLAITLKLNGDSTKRYGLVNIKSSGEGDTVEGSTILYMNGVDDYVEVEGFTGQGVNYNGGQNSTSFFDAHLITGQSTGGGSGGGTTDILPVLHAGIFASDGNVTNGEGFSVSVSETNKYTVTFDTPLTNTNYTVSAIAISSIGKNVSLINKSVNGFDITVWDKGSPSIAGIDFVVTGTEPISVGGGSGGSYTPEKMVWSENLSQMSDGSGTNERVVNTVYKNENDVPLYVQLFTSTHSTNGNIEFYIDGDSHGASGTTSSGGGTDKATPLYIVPAGSTYEAKKTGTITVWTWKEARMPVAVGTGGTSKTATWVSFVGDEVPTILNDSNIASVDRISKGEYEVTFKEPMSSDDYVVNVSVGNSGKAGINVNILGCPLDSTKCYVAMRTIGTTPAPYEKVNTVISLTATDNPTLVVETGGDSIWTDVDGDAVLETDGKKLTIDANVAELGAKARITTDTNSLEFNVGSGSVPEMSIASDGKVVTTGAVTVGGNITTTGSVTIGSLPSAGGTPVVVNSAGTLLKSSTFYMTEEDVDKKLAVMQKIIDKLEKKLK
jgi:hypothetical protein